MSAGHGVHCCNLSFHKGLVRLHLLQVKVFEFQKGVLGGQSPICPVGLMLSHFPVATL